MNDMNAEKLKRVKGDMTLATSLMIQAAIGMFEIHDDLQKAPHNEATLVSMSELLFHSKEAYKEVDDARKEVYKMTNLIDKTTLPNLFDELEMGRTQIPSIGRSVGPLNKMSTSMVDRERAFDWLRSVGAESLITETVNSSTLAGFVKSHMEETAEEPPAEVIKVNPYRITSFVRYTPKS